MPGTIDVHRDGPIGWIVINQPARRNALSKNMWQALGQATEELEADDSVRAIVLRGEGRVAFSAGADISEFAEVRSTPEKAAEYNALAGASIHRLEACRKPTIAMIYGFAVGGGCEMPCVLDFRFAADNAKFGVPATRLGISIGAADVLPMYRLIGPANTKRILFTSAIYSAAEALRMGLVDEIAPEEELEDRVRALVDQIAGCSPRSVAWAKEVVQHLAEEPRLPEITRQMAERELAFFGGDDYQKGVSAFLNKEKPQFG